MIDEFLRLACLDYGDGDPARFQRAEALLDQYEWLARASVHTIAATGDVDAAVELLGRDGSQASRPGGPYGWEPILYLTARGCRSDHQPLPQIAGVRIRPVHQQQLRDPNR